MTSAYFISDIHLSSHIEDWQDERHQKLLRFLKQIANDATHLYLVGDVFDFWFEYKYVIGKAFFPVLFALQRLREKGVEIHLLAGNHDFALGRFFDRTMGIKTWLDACELELAGKRFYLYHGDGLVASDRAYRFMKRMFRNRTNQFLFRWLHPDWGFPFARRLSGSSRKYTNQNNANRDESEYFDFADKKFDEGFDYVLMGHRHNPLVHARGEKRYINLGDWIEKFSYAHFDGTTLELKYFKD